MLSFPRSKSIVLPSSVEHGRQSGVLKPWLHLYMSRDCERYVLKPSESVLTSSALVLGKSSTLIFIVLRADPGIIASKCRAVLPDLSLNGEKDVVSDLRNLVIIVMCRLYHTIVVVILCQSRILSEVLASA